MHADIRPLAPFTDANPLLHAVSLDFTCPVWPRVPWESACSGFAISYDFVVATTRGDWPLSAVAIQG
jgi:hypothetical protein